MANFNNPPNTTGFYRAGQPAADVRVVAGRPREVEVRVFALLPEFNQARVRTTDGSEFEYAITRHTRGVRVADLQEGQRLLCIVTPPPERIESARLLVG